MTTSEQLENEAEHTRAQILDTIAELRDRLTPGHMLDEAINYVRDDGGQLLRNVGRQIAQNPIPVALVGAGLAWLILEKSSRPKDDRGLRKPAGDVAASGHPARVDKKLWATSAPGIAEGARESMDEIADRANEIVHDARRKLRDLAERMQSGTSTLGEQARAAASRLQEATDSTVEAASDAYEQTLSTYSKAISGVRNAANSIRQSAARAANTVGGGRTFATYLRDEPLVLTGIGLAIGAVIGAALPESDMENRLMGKSSEELKEGAAEMIKEQWQKGKTVAEKTWETAKHEAEAEGLVPGEAERERKGKNRGRT